jgi:hypothetical protein
MRLLHGDEGLDDLAVLSGQTSAYRMSTSRPESRLLARELSDVFGPRAPIIDLYLDALSFAPPAHMEILRRRGTRVVFAPTIDVALTSDEAATKIGQPFTLTEIIDLREGYGPESGVAAVYDPRLDWLVFPTAYAQRDYKRAVLHELGHALTLHRASPREILLTGLPRRMRLHVFSPAYADPVDPAQTLRQRTLEALAEGYIYLIDGRRDELPEALASDLIFMLQTVDEGQSLRMEFDRTGSGERTATRASKHELIDGADPEHGHLFASMRAGRTPERWSLAEDELGARRRRPAA